MDNRWRWVDLSSSSPTYSKLLDIDLASVVYEPCQRDHDRNTPPPLPPLRIPSLPFILPFLPFILLPPPPPPRGLFLLPEQRRRGHQCCPLAPVNPIKSSLAKSRLNQSISDYYFGGLASSFIRFCCCCCCCCCCCYYFFFCLVNCRLLGWLSEQWLAFCRVNRRQCVWLSIAIDLKKKKKWRRKCCCALIGPAGEKKKVVVSDSSSPEVAGSHQLDQQQKKPPKSGFVAFVFFSCGRCCTWQVTCLVNLSLLDAFFFYIGFPLHFQR